MQAVERRLNGRGRVLRVLERSAADIERHDPLADVIEVVFVRRRLDDGVAGQGVYLLRFQFFL